MPRSMLSLVNRDVQREIYTVLLQLIEHLALRVLETPRLWVLQHKPPGPE